MLCINLIINTLAGIAYATQSPEPSLLNTLPNKRNDNIMNNKMLKNVICQTIYQISILILVFSNYLGEEYMANDFSKV